MCLGTVPVVGYISTSGQDAGTELQEESTANELDVITSNSTYSISDHEHQNVESAKESPVLEDSCGLSSTEAKPPNLEQAHEERLPLKDYYPSASKLGSRFVDPPESFYSPESFCNPKEEEDDDPEHTGLGSVAAIPQRGVLDRQDSYLATSAAAASTPFSGTPPELDPMVAKLHAEHATTARNSQNPDTLLTTLAECLSTCKKNSRIKRRM